MQPPLLSHAVTTAKTKHLKQPPPPPLLKQPPVPHAARSPPLSRAAAVVNSTVSHSHHKLSPQISVSHSSHHHFGQPVSQTAPTQPPSATEPVSHRQQRSSHPSATVSHRQQQSSHTHTVLRNPSQASARQEHNVHTHTHTNTHTKSVVMHSCETVPTPSLRTS